MRFLSAGRAAVPLPALLPDVRAFRPRQRAEQPQVVGGIVGGAGVGLEQLDGDLHFVDDDVAAFVGFHGMAYRFGGLETYQAETAAVRGHRHVFDVAEAGEGLFQFFLGTFFAHSRHDQGGFGQFFDQRQTEQGGAFVHDVGGLFWGKIAGTHQPDSVLEGVLEMGFSFFLVRVNVALQPVHDVAQDARFDVEGGQAAPSPPAARHLM
mmetsp:Transcript_31247/g.71470  ORF Transcript_31247/g.71470 Transcript_31247/m.71470 type:complete len:208 (-) Transcript_31247:341-964(-)